MSFENCNILVVGGPVFVGSNLCYQLFNKPIQSLTIVDNLLSAETENLPKDERLKFIFGSIADDRILMSLDKDYDYVFHLATYHGNQSSIHDPLADHDNNIHHRIYQSQRLWPYILKKSAEKTSILSVLVMTLG